jgi:hypothetical protein
MPRWLTIILIGLILGLLVALCLLLLSFTGYLVFGPAIP